MTFLLQRPSKGRTQFGVFHNFDVEEETGYVYVHLFGGVLALLWPRH
jgi:hypothetical protein